MTGIFHYLYKKTSTGAIQYWVIAVYDNYGEALIETRFGQKGGAEQLTTDLIKVGKNIGKANETTPFEQACLEAKSKYESKLKKGYVENLDDAKAGKLDKIIEGGVSPMLAHKFSDHSHKITYPALVQPKLDGIRCIAILKNNKCTLWSRTRKPITSVPHIVEALEKLDLGGSDMIFDGELYSHEYRDNFEEIVHFVTQEVPIAGYHVVEYHIYDVINEKQNSTRSCYLKDKFQDPYLDIKPIQLVPTTIVESKFEVDKMYEAHIAWGYEGCMVRNMDGKYVNKRSYDLQKVKKFQDNEFEILGIEEGRGKLSGHVGAFVCKTKEGKEFKAKMSGDTSKLKEYFKNHNLWKGKKLTVQYQSLTNYGIPRFPVGLRIREDAF